MEFPGDRREDVGGGAGKQEKRRAGKRARAWENGLALAIVPECSGIASVSSEAIATKTLTA